MIDTSPAAILKLADEYLGDYEDTKVMRDTLLAVAAEKGAQAKQEPFAYVPKDVISQLKPPILMLRNIPLITYEAEDHVALYLAPQHHPEQHLEMVASADVPLPHHPEPHSHCWTKLEIEAIKQHREAYAAAKVAAERERRIAAQTQAARDVLAERRRQVDVEGWTPEHDDEHDDGELARAAAVYANPGYWDVFGCGQYIGWPWAASWWKPRDNRSNLVKAGALILAEIERMDRANQKGTV